MNTQEVGEQENTPVDEINVGTAARLLDKKKPAPMATCPNDGTPLISTLLFSGAEFYCLECGTKYGFLSPRPAEATPELDARYEQVKAEWDEITGGKLISGGVMLRDCATCTKEYEPHWNHATDEEKEAHEEALRCLRERASA